MFTINLNENEYKFFFRYGSERTPHSRKEKRFTECFCAQLVDVVDGKKQYTIVDSFKEFCSPKDNFDKNVGRKLALTKLLQKLDFSTDSRKVAWEAYFASRGFKEKLTKAGVVKVPKY